MPICFLHQAKYAISKFVEKRLSVAWIKYLTSKLVGFQDEGCKKEHFGEN